MNFKKTILKNVQKILEQIERCVVRIVYRKYRSWREPRAESAASNLSC
jgi:hypothetical protein